MILFVTFTLIICPFCHKMETPEVVALYTFKSTANEHLKNK